MSGEEVVVNRFVGPTSIPGMGFCANSRTPYVKVKAFNSSEFATSRVTRTMSKTVGDKCHVFSYTTYCKGRPRVNGMFGGTFSRKVMRHGSLFVVAGM